MKLFMVYSKTEEVYREYAVIASDEAAAEAIIRQADKNIGRQAQYYTEMHYKNFFYCGHISFNDGTYHSARLSKKQFKD